MKLADRDTCIALHMSLSGYLYTDALIKLEFSPRKTIKVLTLLRDKHHNDIQKLMKQLSAAT